MKIVVAGGDGFCGWPTALYLSQKGARGHDRRQPGASRHRRGARLELDDPPDRSPLEERVAAWKEVTGKEISVVVGDLTDYETVAGIFRDLQPEAFVHFAEHRSAPPTR